MIALLKNDLLRLWQTKSRIVINIAIVAGMVLIAIFFSARPASPSHVIYVSDSGENSFSTPGYEVTEMDTIPPPSFLVSGKYDAIIRGTAATGYVITTMKNAEYEQTLRNVLSGSRSTGTARASRGPGSTIAGFLLMFLLMQGTITLYLFADDKELKILQRIAATPHSISTYLAAHSLFAFLSILVPDLLILYSIKLVTGADIGFSFTEFTLLFAAASILSTALALFLNAFATKGDTANMAGSAIITITTVLAGSFYSFERGNPTLEAIVKVLPQKAWLESVTCIERGGVTTRALSALAYPAAISLLFFVCASIRTTRDFSAKK